MSTNEPTAEVLSRIEKVFGQVFGNDVPYAPTLTRIAEPRWTSLKHVELIIALENEFDLRFDGADATDMTSIDAIRETIGRRLA